MIAEAALAAACLLGLRALAHRAIVQGMRAPRVRHSGVPVDPAVAPGATSAVRIPGPHGRQLFGWIVMPAQPTARPAPAVLVIHGWGANAATMWPAVAPLHAAGYAVLLIDARCHGQSDDEPFTSMPRFAEDIAAGLAWLRTRSAIAGDRLALLGHSVGAGAALLHAAYHDDVRAVISLSAFAHPREMMRRFLDEKRVPYPVIGWYVMRHVQRVIGATFDDIAPMATLPRVRCPVLLVHGRSDTTVPVADAQRLLATCAHASLLLVDGDHDLRGGLAEHGADLVDFLRSPCAALPDSARQAALTMDTCSDNNQPAPIP